MENTSGLAPLSSLPGDKKSLEDFSSLNELLAYIAQHLYFSPNSAESIKGDPGVQGQSAFEVWKSQTGNQNATISEYLESIKGPPGEEGEEGDEGLSAFEVWKEQTNQPDATESAFLQSLQGPQGPSPSLENIATIPIPISAVFLDFASDSLINTYLIVKYDDGAFGAPPEKVVPGVMVDLKNGFLRVFFTESPTNANYTLLVNKFQ